jgi:hypothetical protein
LVNPAPAADFAVGAFLFFGGKGPKIVKRGSKWFDDRGEIV